MEIIASAPARMGLSEIADWAARMERIGFDVIHIAETIHDPFTIAAMALTHTRQLTVRTSMVLALSLPVPADDEHDTALAELVQRCKAIAPRDSAKLE
jgi:alkanesulfonate monooxygenase SsuD/methylene tetrahydromethanopterin reductase-like flavin-dependent oxidoreductase (luciferase family)